MRQKNEPIIFLFNGGLNEVDIKKTKLNWTKLFLELILGKANLVDSIIMLGIKLIPMHQGQLGRCGYESVPVSS